MIKDNATMGIVLFGLIRECCITNCSFSCIHGDNRRVALDRDDMNMQLASASIRNIVKSD